MNNEVYFLQANKHRGLLQGDTIILGECNQAYVQSTQNKFSYLCNIPIKAWGMKLIFGLQISPKAFYKMIVSIWVLVTRQAQSTKNSQFTRSFQYLKDEVDFLPTDKRWSFFQIDTLIWSVCGQACPNYLK